MATASATDFTTTATNLFSSLTIEDKEKKFETFSLLWLDRDMNYTSRNWKTQKKLRESINYFKRFNNLSTCEKWIRQRQIQDEKVILIVSGAYGKEILPNIYQLPQLVGVYVYCLNKEIHEKWAKNYKNKGCEVIINSDELIAKISKDQKDRQQFENAATSMSTASVSSSNASSGLSTQENSSSELNGNFLWSQLLIQVLLKMKHAVNDRQELINICNETSTMQDIDTLIAFRFFITDLYQQLQSEANDDDNRTPTVCVFRDQLRSKDELDGMKLIIRKYLLLNSCLSTTLNQKVAFNFISNVALATNDLCRVVFEIDIDPSLINVEPYADISLQSFFQQEAEILFMLGSIFKINEIKTRTDCISVIKLHLAGINNNPELQDLTDYMNKNLGEKADLTSLGAVLKGMDKYDQAKKCYERQANEMDYKNPIEVVCRYTELGNVAYAEGKHVLAIFYHETVLKLFQSSVNGEEIQANNYNNLGLAYNDNGDYEIALSCCNKTLNIYKKMYNNDDDNLEFAHVYFNIGLTCLL
ncbi:unnamed protein product [Didymodactylos carnosus]|uniref:Uncharacterized protein n=1 Tax=Didymodactylos carnosus TaxID=1234261 RepID=A0A8S2H9B3_9BILA|nr:unnamed protein product [Didymodactylos carnosus]CAF3609078.1 unnamed protein product [Didymodactylos carnosus]